MKYKNGGVSLDTENKSSLEIICNLGLFAIKVNGEIVPDIKEFHLTLDVDPSLCFLSYKRFKGFVAYGPSEDGSFDCKINIRLKGYSIVGTILNPIISFGDIQLGRIQHLEVTSTIASTLYDISFKVVDTIKVTDE